MKKLLNIFLVAALVLLSGCANPRAGYVEHTFEFDGRSDGWEKTVDLLAYDYGSKNYSVKDDLQSRESRIYNRTTRIPIHTHTQGGMPPGEYLYVKWRIKATSEVIERKVDLRPLLPKDIRDHTLTFVIDGQELYVYLVSRTSIAKSNTTKLKTWLSNHRLTYELYPNNTYPKP